MKRELIPTLVAIVAIAILARTAMILGIDSYIYTGAVVAIAGLGGYRLKIFRDARRS